jgi:hypothetical protein
LLLLLVLLCPSCLCHSLNVNLRGDYDKQAEKGLRDFESGKHSLWWRAAQVRSVSTTYMLQ